MRLIIVCCLLSGCSVIDRIADSSPTANFVSNRVYLGSDSIHVKMRRDMDRYPCRAQAMICEPYGSMWECRCGSFDLTLY